MTSAGSVRGFSPRAGGASGGTRINATSVNTTLQTDASGELSEAQAFFVGTSLAQGFIVHGNIQLTFTRRHPPRGTRLQFLVSAGNASCAQAGAPTTDIAYIQADHLNSPRTVTDSQRRVIWKWDQQDPFGANAPSEDPDADGNRYTLNLRFPGQYFDAETGLHYNYYRDYDPQTGRYIQSDPIGLMGGINPYAYVKGDPLRHKDSKGLQGAAIAPEIVIGGGIACLLTPGCKKAVEDIGRRAIDALCREKVDCDKVLEQCRKMCLDTFTDDPDKLPGTNHSAVS